MTKRPTANNVLTRTNPSDDEEEEVETTKSSSRPGTNIHLWQFVKELLLQPTLYGNYIHWIDRQKGVFKIVDSVKVATLWGKRKVSGERTFFDLNVFPPRTDQR